MTTNAPEFRGTTHRGLEALDSWVRLRDETPLEPEQPIIDPHHHIWHDDRGRYMIEELLQDLSAGHNIVATVYAQFKAMYRANGPVEMQSVGEVEFANGVAAASASGHFGSVRLCEGIVGFADLLLGDEVQPVLESLAAAAKDRFRGIRHSACWDSGSAAYGRKFDPRHLLLDATFRRGFARLASMELSFDAWLFYHQLPDLCSLLQAFPHTSVILNHTGGILGIPPHSERDTVFSIWRSHMRELARFPNLTVKLGGLGMLYCGWDFHRGSDPPSSVQLADAWQPYIETAIEAFGTERCMFESNFPVDKQSCGYGVLWNAFKRITRSHSHGEKAALYHDTAARVYRLPR